MELSGLMEDRAIEYKEIIGDKMTVRDCYDLIHRVLTRNGVAPRQCSMEAVRGSWALFVAHTTGERIPLIPKEK